MTTENLWKFTARYYQRRVVALEEVVKLITEEVLTAPPTRLLSNLNHILATYYGGLTGAPLYAFNPANDPKPHLEQGISFQHPAQPPDTTFVPSEQAGCYPLQRELPLHF